jgi:tetratricopeptide (TPR) repeat protein
MEFQSADEEAEESAIALRAQAHAHYGAAVIHDLNGEGDAALREYEEAARLDPENESLVMEVTRRFLQAKQTEKALEVVRRAVENGNASGLLYARLAAVQAQLGQSEQALESARIAVQKSPDLLIAYQQLCFGYLQAKREPEALALLDEAVRRPGLAADFLISVTELYITVSVQAPALRDQAKAKALEVLDRAAQLHPANIQLQLAMADHFNALGESKRAALIYLEALKNLPDIPNLRERIHARLTDIYLRNEDHQAAAEQLKAIMRADPTNPQVYYYLGSIAMEDRKPAEAAEYFSKTVLLKPEFEQAYYDLANAQISAGKAGDALATLGEARKKFAASFLLEYLTGIAFNQEKAYKQARQHYTAAEVMAQAGGAKRLNQFFYFQAGAANERDGEFEQAEKYFNKSLELDPDFAEALNYLGYMWVERGVNLEKAREMIEKAVKAEPDNDAFLDSLGWVLFKLNKPQEALAALLKAVEHAKEPDPTMFDHLGDVHQALGQRDKALEAWRRSYSLEANEAVRKKFEGSEKP